LPRDLDGVGTRQARSQKDCDQFRVGQRLGPAREQLFAGPFVRRQFTDL
jgi:hypothetical protein